jgi:hypothetical protein
MKSSLLLASAATLLLVGPAARASNFYCEVDFSAWSALYYDYQQARASFADLTTWNDPSDSPLLRYATVSEISTFSNAGFYNGSPVYSFWDYMQVCGSSTGLPYNIRFAPMGGYSHFHLSGTDPAMLQGESAGCVCDPRDGYGPGLAPLINGKCPAPVGCAPWSGDWASEPRSMQPHDTSAWIVMYMDGHTNPEPHHWSGDGMGQNFWVGSLSTGGGGSMEAWYLDWYGNWWYAGPIPPNAWTNGPNVPVSQVWFRSYGGSTGSVSVYSLNSIQVAPVN